MGVGERVRARKKGKEISRPRSYFHEGTSEEVFRKVAGK